VRVRDDHEWGEILNAAAADYTGGDSRPYSLSSNEIRVMVGRISALSIGPSGNPTAGPGGADDCVVLPLSGSDTTYTFWHEVLNAGNFIDTVQVVLADSTVIPSDWQAQFVDSDGRSFSHSTGFAAEIGALASGGSRIVGLRLRSSPERFRLFPGRELSFNVEARSRVDSESRDFVQDVLVKNDMPLLSVKQSIREPTALVGDVLSYMVTVENLTDETEIDSVLLVENLSAGLGFAGGSEAPGISGNVLSWKLGKLSPGEKRSVVFRARVKAGQEWGRLVSTAWVYGVSALGERTSDGPAAAAVHIIEGVFTRRGTILGSVFVDTDGDGVRGMGEAGVAGASVFLEDGTFSITDSLGQYSIPGVFEGTHVVRIDPSTLPDTLEVAHTGYFGFGVPGERCIVLAPSGNRRADFPLSRSALDARGESFAAIEGFASAVVRHGAPRSAAESNGAPSAVPEAASQHGSGAAGGPESQPSVAVPGESSSRSDSEVPGASMSPAGSGGTGETRLQAGSAAAGGSYEALTIPSTYFAPASAHLEEIPLRQIATLGLWIKEHPGWTVFISGHTDNVPIRTAEFPTNFELSLARARAVFQLLRMNGIPEDRMDYTGCGSREPVASNDTPEGRASNRRVEITVNPPEGYADGDPGLPDVLSRPDTTVFSLADEAGICAEVVKPEEGRVYYQRGEIDVEVLAPLASSVELYVNNVPVGRERIGQKTIDVGNGTIGFIFYGVKIDVGRNDILVVCREHGGDRNTCVRRVYLAGKPAEIIPEREKISVAADGKTAADLVFLVRDESGLPVRDGIFATIDAPADLLAGLDVNPHQNGAQVGTVSGRIVLSLPPQRDSRREKIHVSLDGLTTSCLVSYVSELRDWFVLGFGEGALGYSSLTGSGDVNRSFERHRDGFFGEGEIALYGQGEIREGHLLTCAVDTRPVREDRLFRRIEPEKYYPIYGDASELKFNTASRSGTYARLDHRRYSAMFGDFRTELGSAEFTKYHRSFNGLEGESRFVKGSVKAFVTRTDQVTHQEEMPADGTSGFYFLGNYPLIENSEKIRIEVRDRYRPERIVRIDYKQVNRDYDINYMDGSILFKEPVPAVDESLNPVTIVVSYECRNAGEQNFIYGMRAAFDVRDSLAIGTTAVLEEEGVENSSLVGFDVTGRLHRDLSVEGEYAHSEKFLLGSADAFRLKLGGRRAGRLVWNAYYREIDQNFFNPSFSGGKTELGSTKLGADLDWKINSGFSVSSRGYRHRLRERSEEKRYVDLLGHYRTKLLRGRIGVASASHDDTREGEHDAVLMLAALGIDEGKTRGELQWDQIIAGEEVQEYPNRIQAALSRRLWKAVSLKIKHEYRTGSRTGTRHLTQAGLESHVSENLHLFSRYRLEGAMSGERGQATIGLKNRFTLSEDLTATFSAEKLATVSGVRSDDFLALRTGALYTPERKRYRLKGNYEIRLEPERRKHLVNMAGLGRLGERWSTLLKGDLWFSDERIESNRVKGNTILGFSCRPQADGSLTLLSLLRVNYEKNSPAHPNAVDKEVLSSVEANYVPGAQWELEGKIAARWVRNMFKSYSADASTFLYQAHIVRIIGGSWDAGLIGRIVHQRETETVRYGGGLEIGRLVAGNLWAGLGYDFGGHEDGSTSINDFQRSGFHIKLRMKFNEKLMKYFHGY
jgi:outer membrane protein OmpA-like peptidoglycan-associated protein